MQDNGLLQIVYRSTAAIEGRSLAERSESINDILTYARVRNRASDITGVLTYDGQKFAQMLEGREEDVRSLLARLMRDPRHTDLRICRDCSAKRRIFGGWSMAFIKDAEGPVLALRLDDQAETDRLPWMASAEQMGVVRDLHRVMAEPV